METTELSKNFTRRGGEQVHAVDGVNLAIQPGDILVLLGPSGCGKSTLLRCIAGLDQPGAGRLEVAGRVVFDVESGISVPPHRRDVSMMFQSYALWPHMTIEDNVAYPLRTRGSGRTEARVQAAEYLELVGLSGLLKQYPSEVSGGQQQRVAFARALVTRPSLLLLDEPLSNVDAQVRTQLRREFLRIHGELGFTAVYVTHDQTEAMSIATHVAVMNLGRVEQVDTPLALYEHPSNRFTAEFVGAANIFPATVESIAGNEIRLGSPLGRLLGDRAELSKDAELQFAPGVELAVMIRPEHVVLRDDALTRSNSPNVWEATIGSRIYAGSRTEYLCPIGEVPVMAWESAAPPRAPGEAVSVHFPPSALRVFEGAAGPASEAPADSAAA